ncbi:MAG: M15 family metallopeptidase [Treponema sp.]
MRRANILIAAFVCFLFLGCNKNADKSSSSPALPEKVDPNIIKFKYIYSLMSPRFKTEVKIDDEHIPDFVAQIESLIANDSDNLLTFCSKEKLLPSSYVPDDLIKLPPGKTYAINRNDLSLRRVAESSLSVMAGEALKDGVTLAVSSSYRSYGYQVNLYGRNVRQLGQAAADRESAKPGASQHQLGLVVDFGSVTDAYAATKPGKWLLQNAEKYGWSLSFPDGYEDVTGYRWECWHYRYVGKTACVVQKKFFNNVQHFMLEFIDAWKSAE